MQFGGETSGIGLSGCAKFFPRFLESTLFEIDQPAQIHSVGIGAALAGLIEKRQSLVEMADSKFGPCVFDDAWLTCNFLLRRT